MKHLLRATAVAITLAVIPPLALAQNQRPIEQRLPNGKSQQEEILKAEHGKSLKDAAELIELAEQLKQDLEKNDRHVLSVSTLKKTEEIEKLAKRIRTRLRRF